MPVLPAVRQVPVEPALPEDGLGCLLERPQDLFAKPANVDGLIGLDNVRNLAVREAMAGALER